MIIIIFVKFNFHNNCWYFFRSKKEEILIVKFQISMEWYNFFKIYYLRKLKEKKNIKYTECCYVFSAIIIWLRKISQNSSLKGATFGYILFYFFHLLKLHIQVFFSALLLLKNALYYIYIENSLFSHASKFLLFWPHNPDLNGARPTTTRYFGTIYFLFFYFLYIFQMAWIIWEKLLRCVNLYI